MSKMLVKCLKCLQTNADNTVAAGGQGVGWAYCPSSCPVEGKLLCDNDKKSRTYCPSSCPVEGECFFAFACSVEGR